MMLPAELDPTRLAEAIRDGLGRGRATAPFNLDGAETATDAIASLLQQRADFVHRQQAIGGA